MPGVCGQLYTATSGGGADCGKLDTVEAPSSSNFLCCWNGLLGKFSLEPFLEAEACISILLVVARAVQCWLEVGFGGRVVQEVIFRGTIGNGSRNAKGMAYTFSSSLGGRKVKR